MAETNLSSRIIKTQDVEWKKLVFLQQDDFKIFSPIEKEKLRSSIVKNHFVQPFYVWQNKNSLYCLDGKHRNLMLKELEQEGVSIPEILPATFIQCKDKSEAAKMVLLYSSQYAHTTPEGFQNFMEQYNLDEQLLKMEISIPGVTDIEIPTVPPIDELEGELKDKPAVLKITFPTIDGLESTQPIIEAILKERVPGYTISVSAGEI